MESLSKCIRSVYEGQIWANSEQVSFVVEALASSPVVRAVDANGLSLLSKREMDVVRSLAEGLTNREIAERLGLSQHTIKNYLFRVYDKLGVSSRLELLFMTLTHAGAPQSAGQGVQNAPRNGNDNMRSTRHGGGKDGFPRSESEAEIPKHNFPGTNPPARQDLVNERLVNERKEEPWEARSKTGVSSIGPDPLD